MYPLFFNTIIYGFLTVQKIIGIGQGLTDLEWNTDCRVFMAHGVCYNVLILRHF